MAQPSRTAMVFGHPGHELAVLGMLQRHRPEILFLTRADSAGDSQREALALEGLSWIGLEAQTTFLGVSEKKSHEALLDGDVGFHLEVRSRVAAWLARVEPSAVYADAFEHYNVHHDLCQALVTSAIRQADDGLQEGTALYELPLAVGVSTQGRLSSFADLERAGWQADYFELSAQELDVKRDVYRRISARSAYLAEMAAALPEERHSREPFRAAPRQRDFGLAPAVAGWATYDDWGRQRVREGRYDRPILFREHFVPVAEALGLSAAAQAGRAGEPAAGSGRSG